MEFETITCKYCGNVTPKTGVFCMACGERIARKKREKGVELRMPKPHRLKSGEWSGQVMVDGQRETVRGESEADYYAKASALKAGVVEAKKKHAPVKLTEAIDKYIQDRDLSPETVRGYRIIQGRYMDLMQRNVWEIRADDVREALKGEKKTYEIPKPRKLSSGKWGASVRCSGEVVRIAESTPEKYAEKAQALKRERLGEKLSPKTQANDKGLLCSVIRSVTGWRPEVSSPAVVLTEHAFLEPEQIKVFCKEISGTKGEIAALLALSSLRRSELMHLDWKSVDLDKRVILISGADVYDEHNKRVSKDENKNATSRRLVPIMMDQLQEALQKEKDKTGRVVKCAPNTVYQRINAACKRAGLPAVGVHGLRHSFASLAAHIQMPMQIAQEIGGWGNDRVMKRIYTHVAQTDRERYKNDMAAFYNAQNYLQITTEE